MGRGGVARAGLMWEKSGSKNLRPSHNASNVTSAGAKRSCEVIGVRVLLVGATVSFVESGVKSHASRSFALTTTLRKLRIELRIIC